MVLVTLAGTLPAAPQWPQFRGAGGSGVAVDSDFPTRFGPDSNVVWKTALPTGHSSPCLAEDRIFLTGFEEGELHTFCIDRRDGEILWKRSVTPGRIEAGSQRSNPAASTPTADGDAVHVYFGSFGLVSYAASDGTERWRKPLPTPLTGHGASTSPVLAGDRLLLACDQDVGSYLLAIDRRSGETLWRTERPGFRRGFSTPLVWPREDPRQVILAGSLRLVAYDLADGSERWRAGGLPNEMVSTPVAGAGLIFAVGWTYGSGADRMPEFSELLEEGDADGDGQLTREEAPAGPAKQHFHYNDADQDGRLTRAEWEEISRLFDQSQNALIAVRPGGRGDVTATHVVWKQERGLPYVPSPLYYQGRLFIVKKGGIASCFDARTGKIHYHQKRIGALGDYYASPVAAAGKICVASERGVIVVLQSSDELRVLARNDIGEPILATPAIADDRIYVRTTESLYAFGSAEEERATKTREDTERTQR